MKSSEFVLKLNEEPCLSFQYPPACFSDRKPRGPIYLRELPASSGLRGPLHGKGVAPQSGRVQVSLHRPGKDNLSASLPERFQRDHFAGRGEARFFLELTLRRCQGGASSSNSPFGIDHDSWSLFSHTGPPGWTKSTSRPPAPLNRNRRIPALFLPRLPPFPSVRCFMHRFMRYFSAVIRNTGNARVPCPSISFSIAPTVVSRTLRKPMPSMSSFRRLRSKPR